TEGLFWVPWQYPAGMRQQVLLFFSRLLGQLQRPLLHLLGVQRPVQVSPGSASQTISIPKIHPKYPSQISIPNLHPKSASQISIPNIHPKSRRRRKVMATTLSCSSSLQGRSILNGQRAPDSPGDEGLQHPPGGAAASSPAEPSPPRRDGNLITCLVGLCSSKKSRVALRAREKLLLLLLLLAGLPQEAAAACLARGSALCPLLAGRLCHLYSAVPAGTDPADVLAMGRASWRSQGDGAGDGGFPGKESLAEFLGWLDFLDELVMGAHPLVADAITEAVEEKFFRGILQPQLLQISQFITSGEISPTEIRITAQLVQDHCPAGLTAGDRIQTFGHILYHSLRQLGGCVGVRAVPGGSHRAARAQISLASLRLFEELLRKPHEHVAHNLVLRNLEARAYLQRGPEERGPPETDPEEDGLDLEEDPYFTDGFPDNFGSTKNPSPAGRGQVSEVVSSFLCLVPEEAKTSSCMEEGGYDTYVHDALGMVQACRASSASWGWPSSPRPLDSCHPGVAFYEGHFLKVLFDRMSRILDQPYSLNLQVTSVLSHLAAFPHPHLHEYLLDPYLNLAPGCRSLFSVLVRVIGDLMQRLQRVPHARAKLLLVRRQLLGLVPGEQMDHTVLFKGVVVLEEFCKELAAIALVKGPPEGPP
ncbi:PREDICTED: protein FAM160B2, partial [Ficedula albicollis]|uniref:protein FAM160B2 n=1 Tax=Ficedula albicollis TaxID=59894 RepID=UPI0007AD78AC